MDVGCWSSFKKESIHCGPFYWRQKKHHRSSLNGSAAPFDSTSSSSVLMRRYQMWGGSFPKTDRTIFSLGRTCPCWKSLKQCYYTFHNPHPCTKQKFAQRLGAVPSGYPNPTRYPVFLSIPDPTRFSFRYHRVAGNPKHRVLPDISGKPEVSGTTRYFGYHP